MLARQAARALCAIGFACSAAAFAAPDAPIASLAEFQAGMWELKADGGTPRNICLASPDPLVQIHHAGATCTRMVITDVKGSATIHYSCPGAGWGRTSFKVESPRRLRISTQGIEVNAPFDESLDARRTGDCPAPETSAAVAGRR